VGSSKGAVHETGIYSAGVGPNGPTLERFPDLKKNGKNLLLVVNI
jgi:hypothetical protein